MPDTFPGWTSLTPRWQLLSIDSAVPRILSSRGRIGERQLAACREHLRHLNPGDGLVVLCHYPLGKPGNRRPMRPGHRLEDVDALRTLLAEPPVAGTPTLFLHGHVHEPWVWRQPYPSLPHVIDINAGAPCYRGGRYTHGQGFWHLDLPDDPHDQSGYRFVHHVPVRRAAGVAWSTDEPS